jgi:peptidoglycan hydrolase-like protein with peptidoglycan-binding domain
MSDRTPGPISASEKQLQPALSKTSPATESVRDEVGKMNFAADKSPSREEIRLLQTQLKAAGFDPGPVDGMLGPKQSPRFSSTGQSMAIRLHENCR